MTNLYYKRSDGQIVPVGGQGPVGPTGPAGPEGPEGPEGPVASPTGPTVEVAYGDIEGFEVASNSNVLLPMSNNVVNLVGGVIYSIQMSLAFRVTSGAGNIDVIVSSILDTAPPANPTFNQRVSEGRQLKAFISGERNYVMVNSVLSFVETGAYTCNMYGKTTAGTSWLTLAGTPGISWRAYATVFTPIGHRFPD
jgi:hypothetical protein